MTQGKHVRLSNDILPIHYNLCLTPNFSAFTFAGEETIFLKIKKPTKIIVLHSAELSIQKAELITSLKKIVRGKVKFEKEKETVTIMFSQALKKGKGELHFTFTGILNDKMRGFYRSRYTVAGKEHIMATTQFESTDARRAFPCFDEPDKKATFKVSLVIPKGTVSISNTLAEKTIESPKNIRVEFGITPKMSTYLLAFIVGKFEYIEKTTKEGVLVRVYVTPGKSREAGSGSARKKQATFALDAAVRMMSFYADYFGIAYPMKAMQLIAIPDFAAGAMENFGAVTYRETAILVDPLLSATANKQWVALVIAHELAHQWFGDLVTMEWWTHLWLNEGFASYIEYLAVDHVFPEWNIWKQFVFMDQGRALELDGLKNTHPIEIPVHHPSEISEIFDDVSYRKGSSIIRMIARFVGDKALQKGLQIYLKKHAYGNASTQDLWKAFEKSSGKPIGKIMKSWTSKAGYPLLVVSRKNTGLEVSQSRFFSSPVSQRKEKDATMWSIPIEISIQSEKKPTTQLMTTKTLRVVKQIHGWFKLNTGEYAFARVQYPFENLLLLQKTIEKKDKQLTIEDKFGIIRDAFALAEAGYMQTHEVLQLVLGYADEEGYILWAEIATQLSRIDNLLANEDFYHKFHLYERRVFQAIYKKIGWEKKDKESYETAMLRSLVLSVLGRAGEKEVIQIALKKFGEIKAGKKVDADLRGVIYTLFAQNGGKEEYKKLVELYEEAQLQEEKDRILRSMCAFRSEKLLEQTLSFSFSEKVRAQDSFRAVNFVFGNPVGREVAWKFLKARWREIFEKYNGGHLLTRFIYPAENLVTFEKAKEVETFFQKHSAPGIERTVLQTVETIVTNAHWLHKDRATLRSFLSSIR